MKKILMLFMSLAAAFFLLGQSFSEEISAVEFLESKPEIAVTKTESGSFSFSEKEVFETYFAEILSGEITEEILVRVPKTPEITSTEIAILYPDGTEIEAKILLGDVIFRTEKLGEFAIVKLPYFRAERIFAVISMVILLAILLILPKKIREKNRERNENYE